jgi:hypothetical protein
MKPVFQHDLSTSFILWFDHYLLDKGEAYYNTTGEFFNYNDSRVPSTHEVFGSAYKQFVSDSSITGANVASGVYVNSVWTPQGTGCRLDYNNGRVLTTGVADSATVTGSFAVKDFNVYFVNEAEEDLIIERKYKPTSDFPSSNTRIDPYDYTVPAIFINMENAQNDPWAFGGFDKTRTAVKAVVISDDMYKLDGVLSVFADSRNEAFKIIPFEAHPHNEWGDLKSPPYNYTGLAAASGEGLFYVDRVFASKLSERSKEALQTNLFVGFLDFDIYTHRFPRA